MSQFQTEDRLRLLDALKTYYATLSDRALLFEKNKRMARHNQELRLLLNINTSNKYGDMVE